MITVVHVAGTQPEFDKLICAILADSKVRDAIREYQNSYQAEDESYKYKIAKRRGVSGCLDLYLDAAYTKGGLDLVDHKYLCHISAYEKLQDEVLKLSIRQFIELVSWNGDADKTVEQLIAESEVKYYEATIVDDSFKAPRKLDV